MQVCAAAERSHSRAPNDTLSVAGHTGNAAVRSARSPHRITDAPLAKPQAGRHACADVLSRRPAKISEPKSAARPTVQTRDLWRQPVAASVRSFEAALIAGIRDHAAQGILSQS